MISYEIIKKVKEMAENAFSYAQISQELNLSYPTVIKYIKSSTLPAKEEPAVSETISGVVKPFDAEITKYIKGGIKSSKKIEYLLRESGYKSSYSSLHKYIKHKRDQIRINNARIYQKVNTASGEQAQVDWGHCGTMILRGIPVHVYVFVYVLSYSRALYAEFATNQRQKTLHQCHIRAFKYFGGIPKKIRYDNMKTVVISRKKVDGEEVINWNLEFKKFSEYYKFQPELCPKYYPRSKGKVESKVKYVKRNFFDGEKFEKTFNTIEELNDRVRKWFEGTAHQRKHPDRPEATVFEELQKEKKFLTPIANFSDFPSFSSGIRRVSATSMIHYDTSSYWVPTKYIYNKVEIREVMKDGMTILEFYSKNGKVHEHVKAPNNSWIVPDVKDLIKEGKKKSKKEQEKEEKEIIERVKSNPIYNTKVETRGMDYYQEFIAQK